MHSFGAKEWADKCEQLEATIADLQGQVKEAQERLSLCEHELGSVRIDRAILQQRVAQLEGVAYIGDHHFPDATWKARCAELVSDLRTLQADHARVLGLVRDFVAAWDHDGEPDAMSYETAVDKARPYLASLPAQPAQGGA